MDAKQSELLTKIANAPEGYAMVKANGAALKALVADGFVETNEAMKKGLDIAARATDAGRAALGNTANAQPKQDTPAMTTATAPAPIGFAVTGFEAPPKAARAARTPKANPLTAQLTALSIGQGWFFPIVTGVKHPNRATKLAMRAVERTSASRFTSVVVTGGKAYGSFTPPTDGLVVTRAADADGPAAAKPRKKKAAPAA